MPDEDLYAPSIFMRDLDLPDSATVVPQSLPRGVDGGIIETIKRAIVTAVREAFTDTGMTILTAASDGTTTPDTPTVYVDLEYPVKEVQYPGVWVQFSITSLKRAGIDHEVSIREDDGTWSLIQEWEVQGRVTLTLVALKNKDRDRLSDTIVAMIAFSRAPNPVLTNTDEDTKERRGLKTALVNNPYVAMTLMTDVLYSSGQQTTQGTPWQGDILAYEDGWSFDLLGSFNAVFRRDGTYTLRRVEVSDELDPTQHWNEEDGWRTV